MPKTVFVVLKGYDVKEMIKKWGPLKVVSLETDDPVLVIVDPQSAESVPDDQLFMVFLPMRLIDEALAESKKVKIKQVEEEEKMAKEEKEEKNKEERNIEEWIKDIADKLKWTLVDLSDKLPFIVTDVEYGFDEDLNMWTIKVRLSRAEKISTSVLGATKVILDYLTKILEEEKFPEPIVVVVSMEGHTLYTIADLVLDDIIRSVLVSKGLIIKDYIGTIDVGENRINIIIVAEKSPDSKVGLFSGYKVAEEIGKVVKERLKWNGVVRVKMKVGMFDYIKVV